MSLNELHQHPEGSVYIRTPAGTYADTAANFAADSGIVLPALPAGAVERVYTQGVRHAIGDGANVIDGGPQPWDLGDQAIAAIAALLAAQHARRNPPPTLDQVKAAKIAALRAACTASILAGFTSAALGAPRTYPADDKSQSNLAASVLASLLPGLPADWNTPFWCADAAGVWTLAPHTVPQIQQAGLDGKAAIVTAQVRLAQLTASVNAAPTIDAVNAIVW